MGKKKENIVIKKVKEVVKEAVAEVQEEVVEETMVVADLPEAGDKLKGIVAGSTSGFYVYSKKGALIHFTNKESDAEEKALEIEGTYREVA